VDERHDVVHALAVADGRVVESKGAQQLEKKLAIEQLFLQVEGPPHVERYDLLEIGELLAGTDLDVQLGEVESAG